MPLSLAVILLVVGFVAWVALCLALTSLSLGANRRRRSTYVENAPEGLGITTSHFTTPIN